MDSRYVAGSQIVFALPQRLLGEDFSPANPCDRVDDASGPRQFYTDFRREFIPEIRKF